MGRRPREPEPPPVVVFVAEGAAQQALQQVVEAAVLEARWPWGAPPPPAWAAGLRYLQCRPPNEDASPDGDALQAFDWAAPPPGIVLRCIDRHRSRRPPLQRLVVDATDPAVARSLAVLRRRGCHTARRDVPPPSPARAKPADGLPPPPPQRPGATVLVPVALPSGTHVLEAIADSVAEHNRNLADRLAGAQQPDWPAGAAAAADMAAAAAAPAGSTAEDSQEDGAACGREEAGEAGQGVQDGAAVPEPCCQAGNDVMLVPWLAASLAPVAAAVSIQAAFRAMRTRTQLGLTRRLCEHRARLCLQRWWRMRLLAARFSLLLAVQRMAASFRGQQAAGTLCLTAEAFRTLFATAREPPPVLFPEQRLRFAFRGDDGIMIIRPDDDGLRSGLPAWTGAGIPVIAEADHIALGGGPVLGVAQAAELVMHGTGVREVCTPACRGDAGKASSDMHVVVSVPGVREAQQRACLLLALTWRCAAGSGVWATPQPRTFTMAYMAHRRFRGPPGANSSDAVSPTAEGSAAGRDSVQSFVSWMADPESPFPFGVPATSLPTSPAAAGAAAGGARPSLLQTLRPAALAHVLPGGLSPASFGRTPVAYSPGRPSFVRFALPDADERSAGGSGVSPWPAERSSLLSSASFTTASASPSELRCDSSLSIFQAAVPDTPSHDQLRRLQADAVRRESQANQAVMREAAAAYQAALQAEVAERRAAPRSPARSTATGNVFTGPLSALTPAELSAALQAFREATVSQARQLVETTLAEHRDAVARTQAKRAERVAKAAGDTAVRSAVLAEAAERAEADHQVVLARRVASLRERRAALADKRLACATSAGGFVCTVNAIGRRHERRAVVHRKQQVLAAAHVATEELRQEERARQAAIAGELEDFLAFKAAQAQKVRGGRYGEVAAAAAAQTQQERHALVLSMREALQRSMEAVGPAGGVWGSAKPREALRKPLPLMTVGSLVNNDLGAAEACSESIDAPGSQCFAEALLEADQAALASC